MRVMVAGGGVGVCVDNATERDLAWVREGTVEESKDSMIESRGKVWMGAAGEEESGAEESGLLRRQEDNALNDVFALGRCLGFPLLSSEEDMNGLRRIDRNFMNIIVSREGGGWNGAHPFTYASPRYSFLNHTRFLYPSRRLVVFVVRGSCVNGKRDDEGLSQMSGRRRDREGPARTVHSS